MKSKTLSFILFCYMFLIGCYSTEKKYYFNKSTINEIKKIKRNSKYTYINYKLPVPDREKGRDYIETELKYTFRQNSFKDGKTTFALLGTSTMNFGELYRIENDKKIKLDSFASRNKEFIYLNLDPIQKGNYMINSYGCRFGKEIKIQIE